MNKKNNLSISGILFSSLVLSAPAHALNFTSISHPNSNGVGTIYTVITGINNNGKVVGYYTDNSYRYDGFMYNGTSFTDIKSPDSSQTFPYGINDHGDVSGYYFVNTGGSHGFIYNSTSFTDLNAPNAVYTYAFGINNNGDVVGYYI